jgi:hypothetical protein
MTLPLPKMNMLYYICTMYKPYYYSIALLLALTFIACKKEPTVNPKTTTPSTGGSNGGGSTPTPSPVDTSAPLDPDPIKNTIGAYSGSLRVYKFVRNTSTGKMVDSAEVRYDSQLKITNTEGKTLLWEADGSIFFQMTFNGYSTNFADDENKRQYVVFHAKQRYVDYYLKTVTKNQQKGTTTTEGTEGTWYKQSN